MNMDEDWIDDIDIEIEEESYPATEVLVEEHRQIEKALEILEKAVRSGVSDPELYERLADFFSGYADRIHHGKEEEILFKVLKRTAPEHILEIVSALESDHVTGRDLVGKMRKNSENFDSLKDFALSYVSFLRDHILREDEGLFPSMHPYLSRDEEEIIASEFEKVDAERSRDHYEELLRDIEKQFSNSEN